MDTSSKIASLALVIASLSLSWDGIKYFSDQSSKAESERPYIEATLFAEGGSGKNGYFMENTGEGTAVVVELTIEDSGAIYTIDDKNKWFKYLENQGLNPICYKIAWIDKPHRLKPSEPQILLGKTESDLCPGSFMKLLEKTNGIKGEIRYKSKNGEIYSSHFQSWYGS